MKSSLITLSVPTLPGIMQWPEVVSASVVVFMIAMLWLAHQVRRRRARWIQARLEELEAYCRLEVKLPPGGRPGKFNEQAKQVCRLVSERSAFSRVALLIVNLERQMPCAASCGMDDLALNALHVLSRRLLAEDRTGVGRAPTSFTIVPDEWQECREVSGSAEMTVVPLRLRSGRLAGLLAVSADARTQRRIDLAHRTAGLPRAAMPLEMLAANLGSKLERRRWEEQSGQVEQADPLAVLAEAP